MSFVFNFPLLILILLMTTSVLIPLIRQEQLVRKFVLIVHGIIICLSLVLLIFTLSLKEPTFTYMMGHFDAPFGNILKVTPVEALLSLVFSTVMFLSILGGVADLKRDIKEEKQYIFYLMLNLILTSLLALVFTNDLFTTYVFIEINTVASVVIVAITDTKDTLKAAIKYLIMSILASGLFLLGIVILYSVTGHLVMDNLREQVMVLVSNNQYHLPLQITLVLFLISVGVKSALFPFHTWLPDAHGSATSSASAVLSGLVLKGYIIVLLKIIFRVYGIEVVSTLNLFPMMVILGISAMIYGSVIAYFQDYLKRMIAYSTVAQIGYIFLAIGLNTTMGYVVAILHIVIHAFTKSMLFIASGSLIHSVGSKKISDIKGAWHKNKLASIAFVIGTFSMVGLPFFAGFATKVYLVFASLETHHLWIVVASLLALGISTLLNALYYLPIAFNLFKSDSSVSKSTHQPNQLTKFALIGFIIINVGLGIMFLPIINIIQTGITWFG